MDNYTNFTTANEPSLFQQQPQAAQAQQPMTQAAPQQAPAAHGNWLTHLMPTAGGVLGGLFGGVPGAAIGSALAKGGEDLIEHQGIGKDVLTAGLEGATGEGAGQVAGKVAQGVSRIAASKAPGLAADMVKGQVVKGALKSSDADMLANKYGITNSKHFKPIADQVTGNNGALSNAVKGVLSESTTPADLSQLHQTAQELIKENIMQLKGKAPDKISDVVLDALKNASHPDDVINTPMRGPGNKTVTSFIPESLKNIQSDKAFDAAQNFEKLASKAYNSTYDKLGNADPDQLAQYKIFKQLAEHAEDAAFGGNTPIPLTPGIKSDILADLGGVKNINPTAHAQLMKDVSNAENLQDLRAIQAPFVQGSKAANATERAAEGGAGTTGSKLAGKTTEVIGPGGVPGAALATGVAAAKHLADQPGAVNAVQNAGSVLGKVADTGLLPKVGGGLGVAGATLPGNMLDASSNTGMNVMQPDSALASAVNPVTNQPNSDLMRYIAVFHPEALQSFMPSADQQANIANAQAAEQALGGLGPAPGAGPLSTIGARLGIGDAGAYQAQAATAAQEVAKALPGVDEGQIQKELTNYMSGKKNISQNITDLLKQIQVVKQANQNQTPANIIMGGGMAGGMQSPLSGLPMAQPMQGQPGVF